MIHTNDKVIKHKVGLLNLADEGGVDALFDRNRRSPNLKNRVDPAIESVVFEYALEEPQLTGKREPAMNCANSVRLFHPVVFEASGFGMA